MVFPAQQKQRKSKQTAQEEGLDWDDKWISDSGKQVCWTAHGDEDAYQRMIDFAVQRVISYMKAYPPDEWPDMTNMIFGMEDSDKYCYCTAEGGCLRSAERDGALVGASIRFLRRVYDKLRVWLDAPENAKYYREEFKIIMFSFGEENESPPVHKNDKGEWVVNDGLYEGMEDYRGKMFDNLVVWKAFHAPNYYDVTSSNEEIQTIIEEYQAWSSIFDDVYAWNYANFFLNRSYFLDYLSQWNYNMLQLYCGMGMSHMLTELGSGGDAVTAWGDLYFYVITKQSWDSSLSTTELISKFMKAHYGPAGETMEKLYYAQKMHFQEIAEESYINEGTTFHISKSKWTTKQYPYIVVKGFINYIDQAYMDIAGIKYINPDLYDVYKDRIDVEGISHYNTLYELYNKDEIPYTLEEKAIYKSRAIEFLSNKSMNRLYLDEFISW